MPSRCRPVEDRLRLRASPIPAISCQACGNGVACLPLWGLALFRSALEEQRVLVCACVCVYACARLRGLTQRPQLHGDVHVAVLRAVVHGLLQGLCAGPAQPHGPLAAAALAGGIALLHALGQDLLQGQHVRFGLLGLCQELP